MLFKWNLDIRMHSPDTTKHLQGASRTSGGVLWGRALGNVFNFANVTEVLMQHPSHETVSKGRVYVYLSSLNPTSLNHETMNPMATVKVTTSPTIAPILQQVTH
jgi:hypothetical protein